MSKKKLARHQSQVRKCADALDLLLPELVRHHSPLVVLAALSEHVGGSLLQSQETHDCTPKEARAIIERLTELAFPAELRS